MNIRSLVRAVLYKEAIKLRLAWAMLFLGNAAFMAWLFVDVRHLFRLDHPEVVWYRVIHLGQVHYAPMRFVPLYGALLLACIQFLPETRDERLRLSLHLPASSNSVVMVHLAAGLFALCILYLCNIAFLVWLTLLYFPSNVVESMLRTVAPWMTAGGAGYLGTTLALLEPGLRLRTFILAVTAGLIAPLYDKVPPGAFANALPVVASLSPFFLLAALLPAYHFRHRRFDA